MLSVYWKFAVTFCVCSVGNLFFDLLLIIRPVPKPRQICTMIYKSLEGLIGSPASAGQEKHSHRGSLISS